MADRGPLPCGGLDLGLRLPACWVVCWEAAGGAQAPVRGRETEATEERDTERHQQRQNTDV